MFQAIFFTPAEHVKNCKTKTIYVLLKYDLFKKRSFSWYFTASGYLYNVKIKILNQSKNVYIQLKRTIKSLKYVSSCYTVSEKH